MGKLVKIESGQKFNRLTVVRRVPPPDTTQDRQAFYLCKCECGKEVIVRSYCLRKSRQRSCGCYQPEATSRANTTHGHTKNYKMSPEYKSWACMITRCLNEKSPGYKDYGAKGVTVCQEWVDSFKAFLDHIGPIPQDGIRYTLDRIKNEIGYCLGNVRWANPITQANNKTNSVKLTALGKTMSLPEWSRETGISQYTIRNRILCGWAHERAVTQSPKYRDKPIPRESLSDKPEPFVWCG